MEKIRYALGEQDFAKLRGGGALYIDKTRYIMRMLESWDYYFLSRPRRFGKSLFLSTLEQFFMGNRQLFKGLAVDSMEWDWAEYPIIRLDFSNGSFSRKGGLEARLWRMLHNVERRYEIKGEGDYPGDYFDSLISRLAEKYRRQVVVLIDEYEKPLLDTIDEKHHRDFVRELGDFYSVMKENERNIRFMFITGVTRYGHLNIFSGFNNLTDISLDPGYTAICGITEDEIAETLMPGVMSFAAANRIGCDEALSSLKFYYDGYHFSRDLTDIYNPYSLLTALSSGMLDDTWAGTGNSSYLLSQLGKMNFNLLDLEKVTVRPAVLRGANPDYIDPVTLLYQSGYLTIKEYDAKSSLYTLGLPNHEVKSAVYYDVIPYFMGNDTRFEETDFERIRNWVEGGEPEKLMEWLQQFFSKVTYDVKLLPKSDRWRQESDFQFVMYSIISLACGIGNVELEKTTSNGRMDIVIDAKRYVYIIELKLDKEAEIALEQINEKGYAKRWIADGRKIIKIGVSFSSSERGISRYVVER